MALLTITMTFHCNQLAGCITLSALLLLLSVSVVRAPGSERAKNYVLQKTPRIVRMNKIK